MADRYYLGKAAIAAGDPSPNRKGGAHASTLMCVAGDSTPHRLRHPRRALIWIARPQLQHTGRSRERHSVVLNFINPWSLGVLFQVLMIVHFIRNRPETYWFFIILFLGPLGAAAYFFIEVLPGFHWKMPAIERWDRQRRKKWLENLVREAPSQEALGDLARICAQEGEHSRAVELFGEALHRDPGDLESLYGRGLSSIEIQNYPAAVQDLTALQAADPAFRLHQGNLALARAYESLGDEEKAAEVYRQILDRTPVSEAYYGLGKLLAKQGKAAGARQMLQEILAKQTGLPRYLRRQERPWVWKARMLLKKLPQSR
jgi:hypothetical protein